MNIYFDMDGVIADFDRGVKELCGIDPIDQSIRSEEKTVQMWNAIRKVPHFYYKLEPLEEGMELFRILYDACPEKIQILSAQPKQKRVLTSEKCAVQPIARVRVVATVTEGNVPWKDVTAKANTQSL